MKSTKRLLTMAGMGLLAGATLGAGPAPAATATSQASGGVSAHSRQAGWGNDDVVGYYRNFWTCQQAGLTGSRYGAWDDYDCEPVRVGIRSGAWALIVDDSDWDDQWNDGWNTGSWPRGWSHRPQWPGHHFGGRGHHFDGPGRGFDGPGRGFGDR